MKRRRRERRRRIGEREDEEKERKKGEKEEEKETKKRTKEIWCGRHSAGGEDMPVGGGGVMSKTKTKPRSDLLTNDNCEA
ncbi:Hypothetical predicted protein [Octopus vulgaris]|uniref:Uncharacterized protein n=1 Tax=Octopus vulgaris TaxID=6645 RepID=A0AA36FAK5_OCTVU|nr:Hypothetical predicted protein [Octopus vulgaris]